MYRTEFPLNDKAIDKLARINPAQLYKELIQVVNGVCIGYITHLKLEGDKLVGEFLLTEEIEHPILKCPSCSSTNINFKHGKIYFCNACLKYFNI